MAILLFGLAAPLPLIKATGVWQEQPESGAPEQRSGRVPFELGYVAAALAAGFIAFNRYLGLSTGWIRFIQTELALESGLDELRYDWVALLAKTGSANPGPERVQAMIQRLRTFMVFANGQTQLET
jgi:hypothetical protein